MNAGVQHSARGSEGKCVVRSKSTTAANLHDVTEASNLLRGGEKWCGAIPDIRQSIIVRREGSVRWR